MDSLIEFHAQCNGCGRYSKLTNSSEYYGNITQNITCECGSNNWNPQSVISPRTFNPEAAKRKEASLIKQIRDKASRY